MKERFTYLSFFLSISLLGMASSSAQSPQNLPPEVLAYPEMVLYNGQILTVDDSFTIAEAVAVRGEKFLALGTNQRIRAMAGPETRQIDLRGKTVIPGFIDTHYHFNRHAERGLLPRVIYRTRDQWVREIKRLVDAAEPGEWVILRSERTVSQPWADSVFGMTKKDLDPISPNNPVFVWTSPPGNDALVNSYALRLAKMPLDTPGLIKDPVTGEPNGVAQQVAYGTLYYEVIPQIPVEERLPYYKQAMKNFNAVGKTMMHGRYPGSDFSVFKRLWEQGELTVRFRIAHEFARNAYNPEALIKRVGNLSGFGDDWLKISAANVGNPDDASVDALLASYEKAHEEKSLVGQAWAFDHSLMVTPEHIATAQRLGLIASASSGRMGSKNVIRLYGADEVFKISPMRSLMDAGIRVVMEGGDPGSPPLERIENFVTRKDEDGRVWNEAEKVTRTEGLYMATNWAAYYTGDEDTLGSIEPGKLADLVVIGGDFLTVPEDDLSELKVLMTVVGGQVVHEVEGEL